MRSKKHLEIITGQEILCNLDGATNYFESNKNVIKSNKDDEIKMICAVIYVLFWEL